MTNDAALRMRHLEILDEALNAFHQETGLTAEKAWLDVRIPVRYADATIRLGDPARLPAEPGPPWKEADEEERTPREMDHCVCREAAKPKSDRAVYDQS